MKDMEDIIKLYEIYSKDVQKYDTLIWQFPIALITVNILAIYYFIDHYQVLFFVTLVNFVLLHALFKHAHHRHAIITAIQKIELKLQEYYEQGMVPNFRVENWILKIKSTSLILYILLILNIGFFFYVLWRLY